MKILIEKFVSNILEGEYIENYYIFGKLENGDPIEFSDYNLIGEELKDFINKKVNCLLKAFSFDLLDIILNPDVDTSYYSIFKGNFIEKYFIPEPFASFKSSSYSTIGKVYKGGYPAMRTDNGIILIDKEVFKFKLGEKKINEGDSIYIDVNRLDLVSWHPIEE
ncbi:MAG: hypothetical protein ACFE8B_01530 [Candidatus Hermodarchaeota archaeon]